MDLPSRQELLFKTPLYESFPLEDTPRDLTYIFSTFIDLHNDRIDGYCPYCQKDTTFVSIKYQECSSHFLVGGHENLGRGFRFTDGDGRYSKNNRIHTLCYKCVRDDDHRVAFVFLLQPDKFFKIGQYPSMSEGLIPNYKKYRSVLPEEKHKELIKGIGLISHDVGIGAFVYLRRIFEYLIEEAHRIALADADWDNDAFIKARMDDKIQLLKHHLPSFLVDNRKLYGILSKGVHELSEQECLSYFDAVKVAIELILDEKLEQKKREDKIKTAAASLSKIQADLKK